MLCEYTYKREEKKMEEDGKKDEGGIILRMNK